MKLKFKLKDIPTGAASRFKPGKDNIPLIQDNETIIFLWVKDSFPNHPRHIYKLKKL